MSKTGFAASDGEQFAVRSNDQDWLVSWHPPAVPPEGKSHGAAGICAAGNGEIVLISHDGKLWDLPAGRPEEGETWEQTLHREMLEEACATVFQSRLLGFVRSVCVNGHEEGLVLVRSFWRAEVELAKWEPQFEIKYRRVVPESEVLNHLAEDFIPIFRRALYESSNI